MRQGSFCTRRRFLGTAAAGAGAAFFQVPGLFAEELAKTPYQTEGPFYPDKLPLDTDNDLIVINAGARRDHLAIGPHPERQRRADPKRDRRDLAV
jgi:hypothetical protein